MRIQNIHVPYLALFLPLAVWVAAIAALPAPAVAGEFSNRWPTGRTYDDPALAAAMAGVEAGIAEARKDGTQPTYHFRPPARWMNDVCAAIYHQGFYHVFYQLNPFSGEPSWHGGQTSAWGHARSKDLVHWDHLPIALVAVEEMGELRCNSGCVVLDDDGTPTIFYTYVPRPGYMPPPDSGWVPGDRQQMIAKSSDSMITWTRSEQNPVVGRRASGIPSAFDRHKGWSDPFIFRTGGRTLVTFKACDGIVCEAANNQYTRWKYVGTLQDVEGECPNLIELDGRWLMVTSGGTASPQVQYKVGTLDAKTLAFDVHTQGILDHGYGPKWLNDATRGFYGTSLTRDPRGRVLIFGWAGGYRAGRPWNSCMGLPRAITLGSDGRPRQHPARELQSLRAAHTNLERFQLDDESRVLSQATDAFELVVAFRSEEGGTAGVRLRRSADGQRGASITFDGKVLDVAGTRVSIASHAVQVLKLNIFVDKDLVEVFVNDGIEVVTREIEANPEDKYIEIFANGGKATIERLDLWEMKAIWPEAETDK